MQFLDRVEWARGAAGISAREVCRLAGLRSETYLSSIKLGKNVPGSDVVMALARLFGVSTDWLLGNSDVEPDPNAIVAAVSAARADRSSGPLPQSDVEPSTKTG